MSLLIFQNEKYVSKRTTTFNEPCVINIDVLLQQQAEQIAAMKKQLDDWYWRGDGVLLSTKETIKQQSEQIENLTNGLPEYLKSILNENSELQAENQWLKELLGKIQRTIQKSVLEKKELPKNILVFIEQDIEQALAAQP